MNQRAINQHAVPLFRCRHALVTRRITMFLLCFLVLLAVTSHEAVAQQSPRDARRQFVEGLLKSLIESQLDRAAPRPNRPPGGPVDANLVAARNHLSAFSTHCGQLVNHWNANLTRVPESRHLLPDLIKLNASVSHVQNRALNARRVEDLRSDFVALDRDWRLLAHRLQRVDGISPECSTCIRHINNADTSLCKVLGVTPQVDFNALATATIGVNTSLAHLIEDIELELPRTRLGRSLIAEVSHVRERAALLSNAVSRRKSYDELVASFGHFYDEWREVAGKIRQVESRHLDRNLRRVDEASHLIHELLWLPEEVDYERLTYLSVALKRDVDRLFDAVSLNVLLRLPRDNQLLSVADDFYGLCENFVDSVEIHAPLSQLQEEYFYLVESWPELSGCLKSCRDREVVQSLKSVEESFATLRDAVGLVSTIDWRHANEVAAALVVSSDNVIAKVQRRVYSNARYDQRFRFESARDAAAFRAAARRLHESILNHQPELLAERCAAVAEAWKELTDHCFRRLVPADQLHLRELRNHVTEEVVELQAMLQI